jgi:hypothetical protein
MAATIYFLPLTGRICEKGRPLKSNGDSGKSRVGMEGYLRPRRLAGANTRIYFNRAKEVLGAYDRIAG